MQPRTGTDSQEGEPPSASELLFQAFSRLRQTSPHCFAHISKCHCFLQHLLFLFFFFLKFDLFITKAEILQSEEAGIKKSRKQIKKSKQKHLGHVAKSEPAFRLTPVPVASRCKELNLLWQGSSRAAGRAELSYKIKGQTHSRETENE